MTDPHAYNSCCTVMRAAFFVTGVFATAVSATLDAQTVDPLDLLQTDSGLTDTTRDDTRSQRSGDPGLGSFQLHPYGSHANFNPLSMLVNRGLDIWQLDQYSPSLTRFPYAKSAASVGRAVTHPREVIDRMGAWQFLSNEILPLRWGAWDAGDAAWAPNYMLHFFMGGVTYVRTEGWFAERGWPAPKLWSGATVMAAAYLTEMAEVGDTPAGASAFADLVVFDLGGVLAFNIPWVRNLFGERLRVMDWSLQPVFTPHAEVYNQGDYMAIKFGLPFGDDVDLLWRLGLGSWWGVSFPRGKTDAISFALGAETTSHTVDSDTRVESITAGFAGGIFYDRNGSLLTSLEWGFRERLVSLNVYPGVLPQPLRDTGLWLSLDRDLRPRIGLTARVLGLGLGLSPRGPDRYDALRP